MAPVDYVDYGISNSGDVTVAFIRMKTAVGAAEVRRVLLEQRQQVRRVGTEWDPSGIRMGSEWDPS